MRGVRRPLVTPNGNRHRLWFVWETDLKLQTESYHPVIFSFGSFMQATANNFVVLTAGRTIGGVGIGSLR